MKKISIVVSIYNEESALPMFYSEASRVLSGLSWDYELIFVNDGSQDRSPVLLREYAAGDPKVRVINFSRNFGHEAAMIAGLDYALGDGVICMDGDLQHPPEKIPEIVEKLEEGYDVISMVREKNPDAGPINRICSSLFYKILNFFSPITFENNSSDFFAVSSQVAQVLRQDYRERVRYLRGFVQSIGFSRTSLSFEAPSRVAGESKYSFMKLVRFSVETLCSFSDFPLKVGMFAGTLVGGLGLLLMVYSIIMWFVQDDVPSGYSTLIVILCFLFAVLFWVVGLIGQYISILFKEIKGRPIYIVKEVLENRQEVLKSRQADLENRQADLENQQADQVNSSEDHKYGPSH